MNETRGLIKHPAYLQWFMVLLMGLVLAGCGSDGNDGGAEMRDPILGKAIVTVVPTVTATAPLATTPIVTSAEGQQ